MGDRLRLSFFVKENDLYDADLVMMWFENESDETILGDNYPYYIDYINNKKDIKLEFKHLYPKEKGLFKEFKMLINKMQEYESNSF